MDIGKPLADFVAELQQMCKDSGVEICGQFAIHGEQQSIVDVQVVSRDGLCMWKNGRVLSREEADKL